MFAKERQDKIYEIVKNNGAVTASALVKLFDVSIETVRRDLLEMERHGLLSRVHGGAVAIGEMKPYLDLNERNKEFTEQKRHLALKASEFISDGDIIGIDSGSTAISFSEVLKEKFSKLTVITNSLDVFNILCDSFSVILCGGHYLPYEKAFYGSLTLSMLKNLHMQKAFIFPSAVSFEFGICDYQKDLYQIQEQMIKSSDEIFILADSSKFEKKALLKIDDMKTGYRYITDCNINSELEKLYKEHNINLFIGGYGNTVNYQRKRFQSRRKA